MAKTKYHLHLKGYVGGYDFDSDYVDWVLNKNSGQEVNVLIDSLGGKADTALSIYAAFKRHGMVNVHFVGMNASAATIASMGAKHISMDASAMYLVHKCSTEFFKWAMLNAEGLQALIDAIAKQKEDMDKMDANVASIYARRCKKSPEDLLELMKKGGWLSSQEAVEWGFVDEITEFDDDQAPVLDEATISAMASEGIPMPKGYTKQKKSILASVAKFFGVAQSTAEGQENTPATNSDKNANQDNSATMKKILLNICALLALDCLTFSEDKKTGELTEEQFQAIEDKLAADKATIESLTAKVTALESEKTSLSNQVAELSKKPAEESHQVVNEKKTEAPSEIAEFVNTKQAAAELYNMFD